MSGYCIFSDMQSRGWLIRNNILYACMPNCMLILQTPRTIMCSYSNLTAVRKKSPKCDALFAILSSASSHLLHKDVSEMAHLVQGEKQWPIGVLELNLSFGMLLFTINLSTLRLAKHMFACLQSVRDYHRMICLSWIVVLHRQTPPSPTSLLLHYHRSYSDQQSRAILLVCIRYNLA